MGFGWLFIGYFAATLMTLNQAGALIRLVGYGIILFSAGRLRQYHASFTWMGIGAILMLCVSGALAFADVTNFLYENLYLSAPLVSESVREGIGYAEPVLSFLFHGTMLYAIRAIARETEDKKIADNAVRNFVFICMYVGAYAVSLIWRDGGQKVAAILALVVWILYFAWIVLDLVLIFSCYARICDENDAEMAQKPSRFAFVNRFREKNDRHNQKAREEYDAYQLDRRARRENKRRRGKQ